MSIDNLTDFLKYVHDHPIQLLTTLYEPIELPIPVAIQKGLMTIESAAQCMASVKKPVMKHYEVEQIVKNGDFSGGTTSWYCVSANFSMSSNENTLKLKYVQQKPYDFFASQSYNSIEGHVYYFRFDVMIESNDTTYKYINPIFYGKTTQLLGSKAISPNEWYFEGYRFVSKYSNNTLAVGQCGSTSAFSIGDVFMFKNVMVFDLTASGLDTILDTAEKCEAFFGKHYLSTGKHTLLRYPQGYSALVLDTETMELKEQNAIGENPQYYIGDDGYLYKND